MSKHPPPIKLKPLSSERFEITINQQNRTYKIHDKITGFVGLSYHSKDFYEDLRMARKESAEHFNKLCEREIDLQRGINHNGYVDRDDR